MGKMSDLLIDGATNEEMNAMIDNAREQHSNGYIQFLEEHLEKAEEKINKYKILLQTEMGPGYCVECFEYLPKGEIVCAKCQDELDGRWDHLRE